MLRTVRWDTPVGQPGDHQVEVRLIQSGDGPSATAGFVVHLTDIETEALWQIQFWPVQAFKWTCGECGWPLQPTELWTFMEVPDSPWVDEVGANRPPFMTGARHLVIVGDEDRLEVVSTGQRFELLRGGYDEPPIEE